MLSRFPLLYPVFVPTGGSAVKGQRVHSVSILSMMEGMSPGL
ncbi:MAG TPA: hypothetical protein VJT73_20230 [Polyangiaceae bacterium]|nr:hypothetical protein [Polyangiaceae bacterium]